MDNNELIDNFSRIYYCDSSNNNGYKSKILEDAKRYKPIKSFFNKSFENNIRNTKIKEIENFIFQQSKITNSYTPLLCLRCRISDLTRISFLSILKKLSRHKIVSNNIKKLRIDLLPFLLDDNGSRYKKINKSNSNNQINDKEKILICWEVINKNSNKLSYYPFGLEIIKSYNEKKDLSLSNWTYMKVKSNKNLKKVLREYGIETYSNWSLISKSSSKQLKMACEFLGINDVDGELNYLIKKYLIEYPIAKLKYKAKNNTIFGWKPNNDFYLSLVPSKEKLSKLKTNCINISSTSKKRSEIIWEFYEFASHKDLIIRIDKKLREIADILRVYKKKQKENLIPNDYFHEIDEDPLKRLEILEGIETLKIVNKLTSDLLLLNAKRFIKDKLENQLLLKDESSDKRKAWELYAKGYNQRDIASKCDRPQTWVSNLIKEKSLSKQIAEKILPELKLQFNQIINRNKRFFFITKKVDKSNIDPIIIYFEKEINKKSIMNKSEIYTKVMKYEKKITKINNDTKILDNKIREVSQFLLSKSYKSSSNYLQELVKNILLE